MSDTSSDQPTSAPDDESTQQPVPVVGTVADDKVVIVTPDGMGIANRESEAEAGDAGSHHAAKRPTNPADLVEEPAKVMRIGAMIKQLLEARIVAELDRPAQVHRRAVDREFERLGRQRCREHERRAGNHPHRPSLQRQAFRMRPAQRWRQRPPVRRRPSPRAP